MNESRPAQEIPDGSIAVIMGTRPELIKLAPLVALFASKVRLIHTGQHFDAELVSRVARDLRMPPAAVTIDIGGLTRGGQIGRGTVELERHLVDVRAVIVQGDTNSGLAGALAANSVERPLFHVEAGLRSFDRRMPEEHNRVLIDHLADMCWAPTTGNETNLLSEGISESRITVTGNSVIEALWAVLPDPGERRHILDKHGLRRHGYVLATVHRPENVDDPLRLATLMHALNSLPLRVILPLHPRTAKQLERGRLAGALQRITFIPPIGYLEFLGLLAESALVVSDSGGIQEEVSVLKVPMIVVRRSTERPEVLGTFARLIYDAEAVIVAAREVLEAGDELRLHLASLDSPFGDGKSSNRMVESIIGFLGGR